LEETWREERKKGWKEGGKEREVVGIQGKRKLGKRGKVGKVGKWRSGRRKFTGGKKEE